MSKKEPGVAAFNRLYHYTKHKAKMRGIIFALSKDEFKTITSGNCFYCNKEPKLSTMSNTGRKCNGDYIYNGIDRKNNNLDYHFKNCVACCWDCNRAKGTLTYKEFLILVQNIFKHRVERYYHGDIETTS